MSARTIDQIVGMFAETADDEKMLRDFAAAVYEAGNLAGLEDGIGIGEGQERQRLLGDDGPFVVRQFEGQAWVPLQEAARLHVALEEAGMTIAGLRNALAFDGLRYPQPYEESLGDRPQR